MEYNRDCYVNVVALSEVFLNNYAKDIKDNKTLILNLIKRDNLIIEREIEKENLSNELLSIFQNEVSELKEITLNYINKDGSKTYLTGISIF